MYRNADFQTDPFLSVLPPSTVKWTAGAMRTSERDAIENFRAQCQPHHFEAMLRHSALCFVGIADRNARPVFVNDAGLKLVGLSLDVNLEAITILDFVAEIDRERMLEEALPATFSSGSWEGLMRFQHFDSAAVIPMSQQIFLNCDKDGQITGLSTIAAVMPVRSRDKLIFPAAVMLPDYDLIVDVARAATDYVCRRLGGATQHRRATIGLFALQYARAGQLDALRLATTALENANANPDILDKGLGS